MSMVQKKEWNILECLLFVAGDPVSVVELSRVLALPTRDVRALLAEMEMDYRAQARGVQLLVTEETAQLVSNRDYIDHVEQLLQPEKTRSVSQSMLETLAVVAYRQPVTRAEIEAVRGVRCEYAVSQLQKLGLIAAAGHKNTAGRPTLFGTTDRFLRQFGLHSLEELPEFSRFSEFSASEETAEVPV